jgi:MFS family permease
VAPRKSKFFYGYVIVAASFCIMTLAWGSNRTFGVFVEPMLVEFGWTRAAVSGSFTINMLVMGILALAAGKATDTLGPRLVLAACGVLLGLSYILSSQVHAIWQFYLFFGIMGGAGMSGLLTPMMSVVARWFWKRRSLMSGILVAGPAVGNTAMPLACSFFISSVGWRVTYALVGIAVVCVIAVCAWFIRRDPADMGLAAFGSGGQPATGARSYGSGFSLREALRTRQFWLINVVSFCDLFLINVIVVHIVIHGIDLQIPATRAASVLSLAAGVSIPGRIIMGAVADRIGNRPALMICLCMSMSAFVLLLFARSIGMLYLFAGFYGIGLWSSGAIVSPLIAEFFGLKSHATIYSVSVFTSAIGSAAGPVIAGVIFDVTGKYYSAFIVCLLVSVISFSAVFFLRPPVPNRSPAPSMGNLK